MILDTSSHNIAVRKFFEKNALNYAREINIWITRRRADFIKSVAWGRVLDVGVGPGQLAQEYGLCPIVACDASAQMIKLAKERLNHGRFVVCDAEDLPFSSECFDTVVASELIYYLGMPERFFSESSRVLRDEGQLVLIFGRSNVLCKLISKVATLLHLRPKDDFALHSLDIKSVMDMGRSKGFSVVGFFSNWNSQWKNLNIGLRFLPLFLLCGLVFRLNGKDSS